MKTEGGRVITLSRFLYNGESRIMISFQFEEKLKELVKKIAGVRWSQTSRCWHIADSPQSVDKILECFRGVIWVDLRQLKEPASHKVSGRKDSRVSLARNLNQADEAEIEKFRRFLEIKRYGSSSIKTYLQMIKTFAGFLDGKGLEKADISDIERFNYEVILGSGYSVNFQRQFTSAAKLFYGEVEKRVIDIKELTRPPRERRLPVVLSKEEVLAIITNIDNLKHRTIISLIYSAGLRIGEAVNMKIRDVDTDRLMIRIELAKGKKDRYVVLSKMLLVLLRNYLQVYKPANYLFEGYGGGRYSPESIRAVLSKAVMKADILKKVTPHTLRHSYATHLLEQGVDLRYVQTLLGHARPETTMIYTHVTNRMISNIESPFDRLMPDAGGWLKDLNESMDEKKKLGE